jgi:hypothetical protein
MIRIPYSSFHYILAFDPNPHSPPKGRPLDKNLKETKMMLGGGVCNLITIG